MAKRKDTSLDKNNFPVRLGFNPANRMKALERLEQMQKKKKPSVSPARSRRVG